ncbi:MAG: GAF domain-containing protein [Candidatus Eremiobacteraeota bacterium]|nr:GAF domain-containing protein [Candidatus Eremiobacteraeota bacterium]
MRLVATTTAASIQRFNDWPAECDHESYQRRALAYLCEWSARIFAFARSDVCKVTLWRPTDHGTLRVWLSDGLSPESADLLELPVHPTDPDRDTFAAMAFRSGRTEVCHDAGTDRRYHILGRAPAYTYASIIAIPIRRGGTTVGVFTVDSPFKDNFRDADQVQKAETCASLCGQFWELPGAVAASTQGARI